MSVGTTDNDLIRVHLDSLQDWPSLKVTTNKHSVQDFDKDVLA